MVSAADYLVWLLRRSHRLEGDCVLFHMYVSCEPWNLAQGVVVFFVESL